MISDNLTFGLVITLVVYDGLMRWQLARRLSKLEQILKDQEQR